MATKVIGPSGDFTSPSTWATYVSGLGTLTAPEIGQFKQPSTYGPWNGRITINGCTTSATNTLTIQAYPGVEHKGMPGDGVFFYDNTGGSWGVFNLYSGTSHVNFVDVEFYTGAAGASEYASIFAAGSTQAADRAITFDRCIFHEISAIGVALQPSKATITNCLFYDVAGASGPITGLSGNTAAYDVRHCTFVKSSPFVAATNPPGSRYVKTTNCAALNFGGSSGWVDFLNPDPASDYNASRDTSAPGAHSITGLTDTDVFMHPGANWNLMPKPGSVLLGAGTPIADVTVDITGAPRSAMAPSIGCFENAAPTSYGLDFRGTVGYVTDPAGYTYCLGQELYPRSRGGFIFGYDQTYYTVQARDRSTTIDPRLAGTNSWENNNGNAEAILNFDVPNGTYDIDLAVGDPLYASQAGGLIDIYDGTTLATSATLPAIAAGSVTDLGGNVYTDAAWPSATRSKITVTITSGKLRIGFGYPAATGLTNGVPVQSLYVTPNAGGGTTTTSQTETGVSRITATSSQTQTGTGRIQTTSTKTETGNSRIALTTTQTATGVARITASAQQSETGVGRVTRTTQRTETGVARVTATSSQTETGVANILVTSSTTKTETGVARITATTERAEAGVARVQRTSSQTETGIARLQVITPKTETAVARITAKTQKVAAGQARITATTTHTAAAVARVQVKTTRTETGVARVQVTATRTETGTSRIQLITQRPATGKARITATTSQTETGVADIIVTGTSRQTATGVARIAATTTRAEPAVARIQIKSSKTETGIARITTVVSRTESGVSRITAATQKTETGVARITASTLRTQTGKSRITAVSTKQEAGTARITTVTAKPTSGVSRIQTMTVAAETAISRIQIASSRTETGVARITATTTKPETGIAHIISVIAQQQSETGIARIAGTTQQPLTGTARISTHGSGRYFEFF